MNERIERIPALKAEGEKRTSRGKRVLLWLVFAIVVSIIVVLFFRSSLSKYSEIQVIGTSYLSQDEVKQVLDVKTGDSFFFPKASELKARVAKLEPLQSVSISKKFPGVLRITVSEYPEVAVQLSADGKVFSVLANGLILPLREGKLPDKPILSGWEPKDPNLIALCRILSSLPPYMLSDLSEIHPDPSTAYADRITLFTRSRFEIVTTIGKLPDKISYLSDIVQNREPGKVVMLEADTYLPYSAENANNETQEADNIKEKDSTQ
ncbi:cell division protein FtsQ/DivIB [Cohnella yongneupensis]|uniref:Cell division protein FtsQ/DivIB n=1 Tax=Cohnella yongneupensis TaxID=425006 RepID=A0ABW0R4P3_9BACL